MVCSQILKAQNGNRAMGFRSARFFSSCQYGKTTGPHAY